VLSIHFIGLTKSIGAGKVVAHAYKILGSALSNALRDLQSNQKEEERKLA
jgi:hypothetical protein